MQLCCCYGVWGALGNEYSFILIKNLIKFCCPEDLSLTHNAIFAPVGCLMCCLAAILMTSPGVEMQLCKVVKLFLIRF